MTTMIDREAAHAEGYIELSKDEADLVKQLRAARTNESGWKKHKTTVTERLKGLVGGAKGAMYEGRVVLTIDTRNGRRTVDLDRLAARWPEAYEDTVSVGAPSTVLNLPKEV